jgi:hypothetical protein
MSIPTPTTDALRDTLPDDRALPAWLREAATRGERRLQFRGGQLADELIEAHLPESNREVRLERRAILEGEEQTDAGAALRVVHRHGASAVWIEAHFEKRGLRDRKWLSLWNRLYLVSSNSCIFRNKFASSAIELRLADKSVQNTNVSLTKPTVGIKSTTK